MVDAGLAGRINAASNLGEWYFGQILVDDLLSKTSDARHRRAAQLRDLTPPPQPCLGL